MMRGLGMGEITFLRIKHFKVLKYAYRILRISDIEANNKHVQKLLYFLIDTNPMQLEARYESDAA